MTRTIATRCKVGGGKTSMPSQVENKNIEIVRWSRAPSAPSCYSSVAAEAEHAVCCSHSNFCFAIKQYYLT